MRYTNGNYEAFVRPRKPQEADKKSAYIVGAGLAGLAAAVFLIRDGQVPRESYSYFRRTFSFRWLFRWFFYST